MLAAFLGGWEIVLILAVVLTLLAAKQLPGPGRDKAGPPLLTADDLVVRVAFFPLLSRRLEVKSIDFPKTQ